MRIIITLYTWALFILDLLLGLTPHTSAQKQAFLPRHLSHWGDWAFNLIGLEIYKRGCSGQQPNAVVRRTAAVQAICPDAGSNRQDVASELVLSHAGANACRHFPDVAQNFIAWCVLDGSFNTDLQFFMKRRTLKQGAVLYVKSLGLIWRVLPLETHHITGNLFEQQRSSQPVRNGYSFPQITFIFFLDWFLGIRNKHCSSFCTLLGLDINHLEHYFWAITGWTITVLKLYSELLALHE